MRFGTLRLTWLSSVLLLAAIPAIAAPGDEVARYFLSSCTSAAMGVAFDGNVLYYTQMSNPVKGRVYKVDPTSGADLGSFQVMRGGTPLLEQLGGLAYDSNRGLLWVSTTAGILSSFSTDTGAIEVEVNLGSGSVACAYDYTRDEIWETDGAPAGMHCWKPDGAPCGSLSGKNNNGITFDGIDIWHLTSDNLDPPGPPEKGALYPTLDRLRTVDYTRAFHTPPSEDYRGLAYDCETFDVPVVWTGYVFTCELMAFEIAPRIECSVTASPRLLRGAADAASRLTKLPLMTANADRIVRKMLPFRYPDPGPFLPEAGELIVYRVVGPGDAPDPTILKVIADATTGSVILTE